MCAPQSPMPIWWGQVGICRCSAMQGRLHCYKIKGSFKNIYLIFLQHFKQLSRTFHTICGWENCQGSVAQRTHGICTKNFCTNCLAAQVNEKLMKFLIDGELIFYFSYADYCPPSGRIICCCVCIISMCVVHTCFTGNKQINWGKKCYIVMSKLSLQCS